MASGGKAKSVKVVLVRVKEFEEGEVRFPPMRVELTDVDEKGRARVVHGLHDRTRVSILHPVLHDSLPPELGADEPVGERGEKGIKREVLSNQELVINGPPSVYAW